MPSQQAMLNIAAYAALSLAGVGSCMLPDALPGATVAESEYVEVPMIDREHATPIDDAAPLQALAWSHTVAQTTGDPASTTIQRTAEAITDRNRNRTTSPTAVGQ